MKNWKLLVGFSSQTIIPGMVRMNTPSEHLNQEYFHLYSRKIGQQGWIHHLPTSIILCSTGTSVWKQHGTALETWIQAGEPFSARAADVAGAISAGAAAMTSEMSMASGKTSAMSEHWKREFCWRSASCEWARLIAGDEDFAQETPAARAKKKLPY